MDRLAEAVQGSDSRVVLPQLRWRWAAGGLLLVTVGTWVQGFLISPDDRAVWWDIIPFIGALPVLLLVLALVDRRWWVRTLGLYVLWGQFAWMLVIALLSNGTSSLSGSRRGPAWSSVSGGGDRHWTRQRRDHVTSRAGATAAR